MKDIYDYLNSLSVKELVTVYQEEYIPFEKTGICSDGVIRKVADMFNELSGTYNIDLGTRLVLNKMAETFYHQNK